MSRHSIASEVKSSYRVRDTGEGKVCIQCSDGYATLCGSADDAYVGTSHKFVRGVKDPVTCEACLATVEHVLLAIGRDKARKGGLS